MSATKPRCSESVLGVGGWRTSRCSKPVTVTRNGKPYCTIHDPERVKARRVARDAKWDAEYAERRRQEAKANAYTAIAKSAIEASETGDWQRVIEAVRKWREMP